MKAVIFLPIFLLLTACGNNKEEIENKPAYTVEQLLSDNQLLKKISNECRAEVAKVGNLEKVLAKNTTCQNANIAAQKYSQNFNGSQNVKKSEYKSMFEESKEK